MGNEAGDLAPQVPTLTWEEERTKAQPSLASRGQRKGSVRAAGLLPFVGGKQVPVQGNRRVWRLGLEGRRSERGECCGEKRAACRWGLGGMVLSQTKEVIKEVMKDQWVGLGGEGGWPTPQQV